MTDADSGQDVVELLGCPWCGLRPKIRTHRYTDETGEHEVYSAVECDRHELGGNETSIFCGVYAATEADAIAAWNRRSSKGGREGEGEEDD